MNVIWFGFILYAIVEAILAAYRVYHKRQTTLSTQPSVPHAEQISPRSRPHPTPAPAQLAPDIDRAVQQPLTQAANEVAIQPSTTEPDLSLAASLPVHELIHPAAQSNASDGVELHLDNADFVQLEVEPAQPVAPEHQSVLAEISQLNDPDTGETIAQLQQFLNDPNDMVRVAIVFKLEEIAAQQGEKAAEAKEMLMQLSQDANPDVRTQATLALTKIDPIVL